MRHTSILLLTCFGVFLASGCGSNAGCLEYAKTVCARQVECSALLAKYDGANLDACQTSIARSCELATKEPDSNWNQDAAMSCAQALGQASCDAIFDGPRPSECRPQGNRAVGAACADGFQCQTLVCLHASANDHCGTCITLPKAGESCMQNGLCDSGLQCIFSTGMCAPLRDVGEVCDADYGCKTALACSNGMCAQPALGQSCAGTYDYCNTYAIEGCDANTSTCQSINYSVSAVGDSCGIDQLRGTYVDCAVDAYCKTGSAASFGVCTLLPREGESCASVDAGGGATYQLCLSPTTCISGKCQVFDRASCG